MGRNNQKKNQRLFHSVLRIALPSLSTQNFNILSLPIWTKTTGTWINLHLRYSHFSALLFSPSQHKPPELTNKRGSLVCITSFKSHCSLSSRPPSFRLLKQSTRTWLGASWLSGSLVWILHSTLTGRECYVLFHDFNISTITTYFYFSRVKWFVKNVM